MPEPRGERASNEWQDHSENIELAEQLELQKRLKELKELRLWLTKNVLAKKKELDEAQKKWDENKTTSQPSKIQSKRIFPHLVESTTSPGKTVIKLQKEYAKVWGTWKAKIKPLETNLLNKLEDGEHTARLFYKIESARTIKSYYQNNPMQLFWDIEKVRYPFAVILQKLRKAP